MIKIKIGIYTATGGIADEIERLTKLIQKPKTGIVLFENDPNKLVEKAIQEVKSH